MNQALFDEVCAIVRRTFAQPRLVVTRRTAAADVPGWDSLSHMFLVMEIEARFHVPISAEEVAALSDIGALCDLIEERRGSAS